MSLRYAALGLLAQSPGSGYDLLRRFELSISNFWAATQSQLYSELAKLKRDELIEVVGTGPRSRTVYAVTDAGREHLTTWLTTPVADPPRHDLRLLRAILLTEVQTPDARAFFDGVITQSEQRLAVLTALRESLLGGPCTTTFDLIALDYGLRRLATDIEWARAALTTLSTE